MEGCLFCRIIAGTAPADFVLDEEHAVAFLDTRPVFKGHTLVVPRDHVVTFMDLPRDELEPFFEAAQRVSRAVETGLEADGVFVAMNNRISQSVFHLHAHVVPRRRKDGLRGFFWPRTTYDSPEEAAEVARRIRDSVG